MLEFVKEEVALEGRTEITAPVIRQFFQDATTNPVRVFNDRSKHSTGYLFVEESGENMGQYRMLVTVQIDPSAEDAERFRRQFTNREWFTGPADEILGHESHASEP